LRLLYIIFVRVCGWMVLLSWSSASKNAELLVLRTKSPRQSPAPPRLGRPVCCRARGGPGGAGGPQPVVGAFLPKLEELVERFRGKVRADVAHDKITAMGYAGRSGPRGGR
jgi:hypothetical protein